MPMKLPFQTETGIQSSNSMSESGDGLMVAATRQKAGNSEGAMMVSAPRGPALGKGIGGLNPWSATDWANVIAVDGNFKAARFSHVVAAASSVPSVSSTINI